MKSSRNTQSSVIFQHVHKCAGTSVWKALRNKPGFVCCIARPGEFNHGVSRDRIPDATWESAYKFSFVRNPYDRVFSAYKMFCQPHAWRKKPWQKVFPSFLDFTRFLAHVDVKSHLVSGEIKTDVYVHMIDNIIHHCSSYTNPKYALNEMDDVFRFENLELDFYKAMHNVGISDVRLPHKNKSFEASYRNHYCKESRDIVSSVYAEDLLNYGYAY